MPEFIRNPLSRKGRAGFLLFMVALVYWAIPGTPIDPDVVAVGERLIIGLGGAVFGLLGVGWLYERLNQHHHREASGLLYQFFNQVAPIVPLLAGLAWLYLAMGYGSVAGTLEHLAGWQMGFLFLGTVVWLVEALGINEMRLRFDYC